MRFSYSRYSVSEGLHEVKTKAALVVSALGLLVGSGGLALNVINAAHAAPITRQVVTAADLDYTSSNPAVVAGDGLNKWFLYNDTNDIVDNTLGTFVSGPATPPNGSGSVEFTLGTSPNDRKNVATYQFSGTHLSDITNMSYVAYSHSGVAGADESPYLNFNVDLNGSGTWQRRLVYVPSANMASVPQNAWNTYDVINGGNALWTWSGFSANSNQWPNGDVHAYLSWNDILEAWPNARLLPVGGWLGVRVGEPGPVGYTGNVDAFTFGTADGTTTYDFEPTLIPTDKTSCKNNGWMAFTAPAFKNQGDCVSFVATKGKNAPALRQATGDLTLANPTQMLRFLAIDKGASSSDLGAATYTNPSAALTYTTSLTCVNITGATAYFAYVIPSGNAYAGTWVVWKVVDSSSDAAGFTTAADEASANALCESGTPTVTDYPITAGHVVIQ